MTRAQIKSRAIRLAFRQGRSDVPLGDNPISDPFQLNEDLNAIVDEIVRANFECYLFYAQDVNANQARYCPPPLIQLDGASILLANGNAKLLPIYAATEFKKTHPWYLTTIPVTDPCYLIYEGKSDFLLYPTPIFSSPQGLVVRGIGFYNPLGWAQDTNPCPLPADQHECICHGLAARISPTPAIADQEWGHYLYLKGHIESEISDFTDRSRHRSGDRNGRATSGTADDPYANPLWL
jgi:hypothetical protein